MTYVFTCRECGTSAEVHTRDFASTCHGPMVRDYTAENHYVSVKARPTSRKRHWGRYVKQ